MSAISPLLGEKQTSAMQPFNEYMPLIDAPLARSHAEHRTGYRFVLRQVFGALDAGDCSQ
jgi:hypothetical protein